MSNTTLKYTSGAIIQLENSKADEFIYIVKTGKIRIQTGLPRRTRISYYLPGDTYGFVSALTGNPHTSTLVAATNVEVIKLSIEAFYDYLLAKKDLFLRFLSTNSERLREYIESLSTAKVRAKRDSYEKLFYHARSYEKLGSIDKACFALSKFIQQAEQKSTPVRNYEEAKQYLQKLNANYSLPKHTTIAGKANLTLKRGDIIFLENEPDDYFYFVIKGKVKISKLIDEEEFILAILSEDEIFGEMAILNSKVRNASAIAQENCILLRLTPDNIFNDIDNFVLSQLFSSFARRIWYASQRFFLLYLKNPVLKIYLQLRILIIDTITKDNSLKNQKTFQFNFGLQEIQKMVRLYTLDEEILETLHADNNLVIEANQIKVRDKDKLFAKYEVLYKKSLMEKK